VADLIAQGSKPPDRWRRPLALDRPVVLGRVGPVWSASWDEQISRRHAELSWNGRRLSVRRVPDARNPIFFKGQANDAFEVAAGEHFVIGSTTFILADDQANVTLDAPAPIEQQAFSTVYLQSMPFRRVGPHIDVLGRLPEAISAAGNDAELSLRLVNLLLTGLPRASAAALVEMKRSDANTPQVDVLHWDRRASGGGDFQPSGRLIRDAIARNESVLHVWNAAGSAPSEFTTVQGIDWAFCTPVPGKACAGWGLYVAGRFTASRQGGEQISDPSDLRDDLKFTELAATTLGALADVRQLERQRAGLSQFFSPLVLEALEGVDPDDALAPRETQVTVLFCDLRGFSRASERQAADLLGLLERVSRALGVTTHHIRAQGGVLGDFHGDAAMGFWGWPLAQGDAALRSARAALAIRRQFFEARAHDDPLADFEVGIGIATGQAVAGKIGTVDQVKVTVFGPVVNLASRLEGMTKILHAPILIDEPTAAALRPALPREEGRLRRVARVRPFGLRESLEACELLPPEGQESPLRDGDILEYEGALDSLIAGDWQQAFERLHRVPAEDRVKDFLTVLIAQHDRRPPEGWSGVVSLTSK